MTTPSFCRSCGAALNPGQTFCGNCGQAVGPIAQASQPMAAPPSAPVGPAAAHRQSIPPLAIVAVVAVAAIALYLVVLKGDDGTAKGGSSNPNLSVAQQSSSGTSSPSATAAPSTAGNTPTATRRPEPSPTPGLFGKPKDCVPAVGSSTKLTNPLVLGNTVALPRPPEPWVTKQVNAPFIGTTSGVIMATSQADLDAAVPKNARFTIAVIDPKEALNPQGFLTTLLVTVPAITTVACKAEGDLSNVGLDTTETRRGTPVGVQYTVFYNKSNNGKAGLLVIEEPVGQNQVHIPYMVFLKLNLTLQ